jgi:hypothetical protein
MTLCVLCVVIVMLTHDNVSVALPATDQQSDVCQSSEGMAYHILHPSKQGLRCCCWNPLLRNNGIQGFPLLEPTVVQ